MSQLGFYGLLHSCIYCLYTTDPEIHRIYFRLTPFVCEYNTRLAWPVHRTLCTLYSTCISINKNIYLVYRCGLILEAGTLLRLNFVFVFYLRHLKYLGFFLPEAAQIFVCFLPEAARIFVFLPEAALIFCFSCR